MGNNRAVIWAAIITGAFGLIAGIGGTFLLTASQKEQQQEQFRQVKALEEAKQRAEDARRLAEAQLRQCQQVWEEAPKTFAKRLRTMINAAAESSDSDLSARAQALISARRDLRSALESVGSRLNSDIDMLATELSKPQPDPERVRYWIKVLQGKWDAKEEEIAVAIRKLLAELGINVTPPPARGST